MFLKLLENTGDKTILSFKEGFSFIFFIFESILNILNPFSYNKTMFKNLILEIYESSIRRFLSFLFLAVVLGSILILIAIIFAMKFNLVEQIGVILISFIVNEFSPIFTTLFFIIVYGLSIQEKIKFENLEDKKDIANLYNAKLINCIFLVPLMSFLFATLMILSACVVSIFFLDLNLETYKNMIINSITLENIFILLIKSSISSFLTMLVPIFYANKLRQYNKNINVASSLKIFIIMLIILLSIELASILIVY